MNTPQLSRITALECVVAKYKQRSNTQCIYPASPHSCFRKHTPLDDFKYACTSVLSRFDIVCDRKIIRLNKFQTQGSALHDGNGIGNSGDLASFPRNYTIDFPLFERRAAEDMIFPEWNTQFRKSAISFREIKQINK